MSDGSSVLTYLDSQDYSRVKQIAVTSLAGPVEHLNELEYIDGVIFANIWLEDLVVMIDPENGEVLGWIDFSELRTHLNVDPNRIDVLNGIAYIPETDQLVITGKLWPAVFAVEVGERPVKLESKQNSKGARRCRLHQTVRTSSRVVSRYHFSGAAIPF